MRNSVELCIIGADGTMGSAFTQRADSVGLEGVYPLKRTDEQYEHVVQIGSIFLLCMKQKDVLLWLSEHGSKLNEGSIVVSLAALLDIGLLEETAANAHIRVCRIMTTTSIAYGPETIAWTDDGKCTIEQKKEVERLFGSLGNLRYLGERNDYGIDQYTFRACVPGWLADICEAQKESLTETFGFTERDAEDAIDHALSVVIDQRNHVLSYRMIRDKVMSKGGITEAGVQKRSEDLKAAIRAGSLAAKSRASTLVQDLLQSLKQ